MGIAPRMLVGACLLMLVACANKDAEFVAAGAFEATEVVVSTEAMGKLVQLDVEEGQSLVAGQVVGRLECTPLQVERLDDQLKKCTLTSPIAGTVLVKYAELGELATIGKALFKIADTQNMFLRAYITADQLTTIKLGQDLRVLADLGTDGTREYMGRVSWISDKAEFTPKTIQTRDERANMVYAMKVAVKNDGFLKIGMYGMIPQNGP